MSSENKTETQQSSKTDPYAPTIPLLSNEASTIGNISTAVTPQQQSALGLLTNESNAIPDLSAPATGAVTGNLTASNAPEMGMLGDAYKQYMANTTPLASNTDLNPWNTPGFSGAMGTMSDDIMKNVKSMYAGSGRDPSGAGNFAGTAARGIAAGEAPAIAAQYNANVGNLENANAGQMASANTASTGMSGENLSALQTQLAGLSGAGALPGILTQPGQTAYTTANTAYGTPWTNLAPAEAATSGIAGLGGTSSGQGSTTQQTSAITNALGLLTGAAGIAGAVAKSEKRLKENIKPLGVMKGQKIHQFNFKSDPANTPVVGVLAHEVQKVRPDAVMEKDGIRHVDYGRLGLGMLSGAHAA